MTSDFNCTWLYHAWLVEEMEKNYFCQKYSVILEEHIEMEEKKRVNSTKNK